MSAMAMEVRLVDSTKEIEHLKEELAYKENEYQDLERDRNFNTIKAAELQEIVELKSNTDEVAQRLIVKSLQNAELACQVQELRGKLDESNKTIKTMTQERARNQKTMIELSDVVRSLRTVSIGYDTKAEEGQDQQAISLENIKRKIKALDEDRKRVIEASKQLKQENEQKDERLQALEGLFHTVNNARIEDFHSKVKDGTLIFEETANGKNWKPFAKVCSSVDGSTEIFLSNVSVPKDINDDDISVMSNSMSAEMPDVKRFLKDFVVDSDALSQLKEEHDSAVETLTLTKRQLVTIKKEAEAAQKKNNFLEVLMRDVIHQYKELQKEKEKVDRKNRSLKREIRKPSAERLRRPEDSFDDTDNIDPLAKPSNGGKLDVAPTFDLTETSSAASISHCSTDAEASTISNLEIEFDPATHKECERLRSECARLEHENEYVVTKIANIELELQLARQEAEKEKTKQEERETHLQLELKNAKQEADNSKNQLQERESNLQDLSDQHNRLVDEHKSAVERTSNIEQELEAARIDAEGAVKKRRQREGELWEVIGHYKTLSQQHESTEARIADIQRELSLTKRAAIRPDIIYDLRRLEKTHQEEVENIQRLEKELALSKVQVARSKEETKSTRSRLVGCHFQYRKLQRQHNDARKKIENVQQELEDAKTQTEKMKDHEASWNHKLANLLKAKNESEQKVKKLMQENKEVTEICEEMLNLVEPKAVTQ